MEEIARLVVLFDEEKDARNTYDEFREKRNQLIADAHATGLPLPDIAQAAGITAQRVSSIGTTHKGEELGFLPYEQIGELSQQMNSALKAAEWCAKKRNEQIKKLFDQGVSAKYFAQLLDTPIAVVRGWLYR